ncbi:cadherin domain/calx-beta domain-containing protein, partial [Cyanobium sp. Copco_Reservoir_LC18]|uniref:Calx-beta domain-containing protein n=1 Tax=Cyanobium sp. Copco_Reservoir_LC18 TaxID=1328305 RepID=UPI0016AC2226
MAGLPHPTPGDDTLDGAVGIGDVIRAGGGNDLVRGNGAGAGEADELFGEDGDDTLITSLSGFGFLDGGPGNDLIIAGAPGIDTGVGGAGNDTLIGDANSDYLTGDDFDLFGAPGSTVAGNDRIDGGGGNDILSGGPGDDAIDGGDGQDQIFGGAENDILSPGRPDPSPTLFDSLQGGDGEDTLALPGRPEDYSFSTPGGPVDVVQSNPGVIPAGEVRATLTEFEAVAFGVSALDLAGGAVPLTTVAFADLLDGSTNNQNGGRPHWSISDSISALFASNLVLIDIGTLLANDFDPDGGTLTLVDLIPTAPAGGPGMTFRVLLDAAAISAAGYNPGLYPEGLLEVTLTQPLTAPVSFTYRTLAEENLGAADLGSIATVTINPVSAQDDVVRGSWGGETFIPYAVLLANDGPSAVFNGFSNEFIGSGGSIVDDPGRGGIVVTWPFPFGTVADFEYTLAGVPGTASVTINIDNGPPVAVPLARVVTPGSHFTISFDEIVGHFGHFDPNLDGLAMGSILGATGAGATFTVTATGVDLTFAPGYSGGFALNFTLRDTSLGAESPASTISFLTPAPPAPVAVADTLEWGIGDGRSIFDGSVPGYGIVWSRELLANDSVMPGTVRLWNVPFDLTPDDGFGPPDADSQLLRVLERPIPGVLGVTDPADNGFGFEFVAGFTNRSDTFVYTIIDPLGRQAQGQVTFNVGTPQPALTDNVITVAAGATSVTVTAAQILGNDTFFGNARRPGEGAIAGVDGNALVTTTSSGVDIGGGRTGIESFTFTLEPGRALDTYQFNILTFDTAADGGSANGVQRVTLTAAAATPTYSLRSAATTVTEGTGTEIGFSYRIERTGPLDAAQVRVLTGPAPSGTSADAADLDGGFGTGFLVNFAAGESSVEVLRRITPDAIDEPNEDFVVTLDSIVTGPPGAVIDSAANSLRVTILDDDAPPPPTAALDAANVGTVNEGNNALATSNTPLEFVIRRTGDLSQAGTVTFVLDAAPGSALTAADIGFVAAGGDGLGGGFGPFTATFAAGQDTEIIFVYAAGDTLPEADEAVRLTLTGGTGVTLSTTGPLAAAGTFANDDTPPALPTVSLDTADAGTVNEGDNPTASFNPALEFVIRRSGDLSQAATVTFVLDAAPGSSLTAADIGLVVDGGNGISGGFGPFVATFAANEATRTISVFTTGDTLPEADEAVRLTLTGGTGVTLSTTGPLSATGTFANDDVPPTVSVARVGTATAVAEGDPTPGSEEGGAFAFTVSRTGQTDKFATSIIFSLLSPDGSLGADDLLRVTDAGNTVTPDASGLFTLTFAAGETSRTLTITARADTAIETDARFILAVENVSDGTLTGPSSFEGSFANDDVPPTISVERLGAIAVAEGNPSPGPGGEAGADFAFAFTRTGQADKFASTVNFRIAAQTAGFTADDILRVTLGGTTLLPDAGGVHTLAFAAGDTAATIVVTARADAVSEADDSFQLTVEDPTGASLEGATGFLATILDDDTAPIGGANRPPTDITLTNAVVLENLPAATRVGQLSATDPDGNDTFVFSFAPNGNPDGLFRLDGNQLLTTAALDFEAGATRSVTLQVTDSAGNRYTKAFTITVTDLAEGAAVQAGVINGPGFA